MEFNSSPVKYAWFRENALIFHSIQVKSNMQFDVLVEWRQKNIFNNFLLRVFTFVRPKVGTTLNVTAMFTAELWYGETERWATMQTFTAIKISSMIFAYKLVDTVVFEALLTTNLVFHHIKKNCPGYWSFFWERRSGPVQGQELDSIILVGPF